MSGRPTPRRLGNNEGRYRSPFDAGQYQLGSELRPIAAETSIPIQLSGQHDGRASYATHAIRSEVVGLVAMARFAVADGSRMWPFKLYPVGGSVHLRPPYRGATSGTNEYPCPLSVAT